MAVFAEIELVEAVACHECCQNKSPGQVRFKAGRRGGRRADEAPADVTLSYHGSHSHSGEYVMRVVV